MKNIFTSMGKIQLSIAERYFALRYACFLRVAGTIGFTFETYDFTVCVV